MGTSTNLDSLKGRLCESICVDEIAGVDISNLQANLFGHDKKSIKLRFANPSSRLHLLKQARQRRPEGIYVSEFLTKAKQSIFYNLRQLRKQYPNKIKSVFTKAGNIFYRLHNSNRLFQVLSQEELTSIVERDPVTSSAN